MGGGSEAASQRSLVPWPKWVLTLRVFRLEGNRGIGFRVQGLGFKVSGGFRNAIRVPK